jgi:hypothetical protein
MKYSRILALSVLAVALVVVGCASVQSQWKTAVTTNTIDGYQTFADKHAKSTYADSAQLAIERLKFEAADKEHTVVAYEAFIKDNPKSSYVAKANDQIDEEQFNAAAATNTIVSYRDFIAKHPGSSRIAKANQGIDKLKADVMAKESAAAQEVLARYPASAKKGTIPAKYVGNWVVRNDGMASQYLLITSSYIIWKALNGPDQGEQAFKPGSYEVGAKALTLTGKMAYSSMAGAAGDKFKMSVPMTITATPGGLKVDAAQSQTTIKGKLTDMHDLVGVQSVQAKDMVKLTKPPMTVLFVKAGA